MNNTFQTLRRNRLTAAMLSALALPFAAMAQDGGSQGSTTDLDRVTVTGSRIARVGFVTPAPVASITAEEIRSTGALTIGDLMTKLPQLAPNYTLGNSTRFIGTAGLGLMDLRGMGTSRTLVLVNGRRHVGASPGSVAVDVNTIPVEWIERVEVMTGGVSAVYGADAVAGVVNFIMKDSFEGFEARGQTGKAAEGSFDRSFVSFSAGNSFADGRGNAAISMEYSTQDRFGRGDRKIGRQFLVSVPNPSYDPTKPPSQTNPQNVYSGPGGNHSISYGGTFTIGTFNPANPATWGNRYVFNPDGTFRPNRYDGTVVSASSCVDCDFADLNAVADLQPAFDRFSTNFMFNFDLNDNHRLFFEGKYSKTESLFYSQPAFDQPIRIRRDNAYISPELGALMDQANLSQLLVYRFNVDAGRRGEDIERQTSRAVFGLEGYLGDWNYEVSANFGQTTISRLNLNNRINERWHAGLDAVVDPDTGKIVCRVDVDPNAINPHTRAPYSSMARNGCVPFSVFGHGAVTAEAAKWFNVNSLNTSKLEQTVLEANIANSSVFSLPAGDVGFAAGIEHRKEKSQENTDPLAALGLTFLNAIPSRGGQYDVTEVYAETTVPLLSGLPGINMLSVDLAGRYSDYSTIGTTTTWNIGVNWEILDSLRFRGTLARAVRAPSIGELFNPQSENFSSINDPCNYLSTNPNRPDTAKDPELRRNNCSALGIPVGWVDTYTATRPGVSGGNPDLSEEAADSWTLGLVWQPGFIDGLGVTVDYWNITLKDAIGAVNAQTLATRCVDSPGGIDNEFCRFITRAPVGGYVDPAGRQFPEHSITRWVALNENLAKSRRVGVDLEVDYRFPLLGGNSSLRLVGSRLLQSREWPFQAFPDEFNEYVTYVTDPRWRANLDARYSKGNWRASWSMQYVHHNLRVTPGSYSSNPGSISPIWNGSYTYHNFQVSYTFPRDSGLEVYIGMDNVFDKDPPLNYFGSDLGSSYYDAIGRYMYMGATYRF
ncbi:TonB-dependent receptor [Pseudoxanthomonas taiwanensis]|uniref:TonB-dependent receptor n=2 Tax=Pseudoxanthomonas taiwanensis TaxID=176598 RepID=A0A921TFI8_9GAMM|nr:TonB-dependent receptor [Pseudoxanthomonas taiwanensis]KAF1688977.1 TonB-dependent receptor [Pseudoxanthomonas taiwanensis]